MSRKYKFYDPEAIYFVTYTTVDWIDVFIQNKYRDVLIDSWKHCQKHKGLQIYAWVIMTNHVHMIVGSNKDPLEGIMRDMKSYTTKELRASIRRCPNSVRSKWILSRMTEAGRQNGNNNDYQFWQQHNHPIILDTNFLMEQKLDYIHENPVKAGFVNAPEDFIYSSARDYVGEKGLVDVVLIE